MRSISGWVWRIGGVIGVIWLLGLTLLSPQSLPPLNEQDPRLSHRLQRAVKELNLLKKQNDDIKIVLKEFTKQVKELSSDSPGAVEAKSEPSSAIADLQKKLDEAQKMLQQVDNTGVRDGSVPDIIPSLEFEQTRRLVENGLRETMFYMEHQLNTLRNKMDANDKAKVDEIIEEGRNHIRVVQYDLERLGNSGGLKSWRERESADLSNLVQNRLHSIQNPTDCAHAKKLVCNLNKGCGYGCQIHHAVYCFIVAYGTQRTMILKSKGWRYNKNGWEDVFHPVSDTCTDPSGTTHSHWPASDETQVVEVPIIDTLTKRPDYLPLAIPEDLSERIMRLHGNPAAWWIGQFLKYLLKPQEKTEEFLNSLKEEFGFSSPIVGIHIRRTDKVGTEAAFHSVEEYMEHVEAFYKKLSLSKAGFVKKVYLASDDPTVITEARTKFPDYTFLGDPNIAKTAAVATRYSDASLKGIIADIHFLAITDYIVCTFSSQVCRFAYEIMQTLHPDASDRFRSLDDVYYYGGQSSHNQKARFAHDIKKSSEMNMQVGDIIGIAGNHWNGYSKGTNRRTKQSALYPSYKAEEVVDTAKMPNYKDVDAKRGR